MPLLVIANAWIVAAVSSHWKNAPPSKRSVGNAAAVIADIAILAVFPVIAFRYAQSDLPASRSEVVGMAFMGAFFTLHVLFIFQKWIKPRIDT